MVPDFGVKLARPGFCPVAELPRSAQASRRHAAQASAREPWREIILMLFLYRKSEQKDLIADQRRILAKVVQQEFK